VVVAAAVSAAFITTPARAQDELAALRARLEQVKALVADLDTRVAALEAAHGSAVATAPAQPASRAAATSAAPLAAPAAAAATAPTPTAAAAAAPPAAVPRAAWRHVKVGSNESDVQGLLGPPTKTFDLSGRRVWYYYYPDQGAGSVFFDRSGQVTSLQAPAAW
jgi:hypothetical protein